jgi:hypothetical protein
LDHQIPGAKRLVLSRFAVLLLMLIAVAAVVCSGVFYASSAQSLNGAKSENALITKAANQRKEVAQAQELAQENAAAAQNAQDQGEAELGFKPGSSPNVYYRFAPKKDYRCGSFFDCVDVLVMSTQPCPEGIYVEASVEAEGVSVGLADGTTAGLRAYKLASVLLQDTSGEGQTFRVTDAHCEG